MNNTNKFYDMVNSAVDRQLDALRSRSVYVPKGSHSGGDRVSGGSVATASGKSKAGKKAKAGKKPTKAKKASGSKKAGSTKGGCERAAVMSGSVTSGLGGSAKDWIKHVKEYAKVNEVPYSRALIEARATYWG